MSHNAYISKTNNKFIIKISTKRLLLRPITADDARSLFNYRSDAVTNKYQNRILKTINDAHAFIKNDISPTIDLPGTWYQIGIIKKENNDFIGDIGIHFLNTNKKHVEIGCTLDKTHHGKGYVSEALEGTINHLFTTLNKHQITASTDPLNTKSIQLLHRLGFRKETRFEQNTLTDKASTEDLVYILLKNDYSKEKQ